MAGRHRHRACCHTHAGARDGSIRVRRTGGSSHPVGVATDARHLGRTNPRGIGFAVVQPPRKEHLLFLRTDPSTAPESSESGARRGRDLSWSRSRWPVWHAVSSIRCTRIQRRLTGPLPNEGSAAMASSESKEAAAARLRSHAAEYRSIKLATESCFADRNGQSRSSSARADAHGSGSPTPSSLAWNQWSSAQARCFTMPPTVRSVASSTASMLGRRRGPRFGGSPCGGSSRAAD